MMDYQYKDLTEKIIGVAIDVHKELGSGFPEKIYQRALKIAFKHGGLKFFPEKRFEVEFMGKNVGYEVVDFLVENTVVVEIKAISEITNIQVGQVVSYLKATKRSIGLILNFAKSKLDIKRVVV